MLRRCFGCDDGGPPRSKGALWLGLLASFCFGCPGVEPSATGTGGGGAEGGSGGGPPATTSSSGGEGGKAGGGASTGSSMGGMNEGGCGADLANDAENCGKCGRACLDDDQVALARCIDGVCKSFCESGFVNIDTPDTGPDDGCEAPGRRVFVTEEATTATAFGGVAGADERCQTLADLLKLGGKWRAWISDGEPSSSVAERFKTTPEAPYMLLDFTVIAGSWADLTTNLGLDHPIDLTENLLPPSGVDVAVWTGTTPAGQPSGAHCEAWTSPQVQANVGDLTQVTEEWTQQETTASCGGLARLYCFEQ